MPKSDLLEMSGLITECMGGGFYKIQTEEGNVIKAKLSGRMRQNKVRVLPGDFVQVAVSPCDMTHGRITFRGKRR